MKINWCKIIGHKWTAIFAKCYYNDKESVEISFFDMKCKRCMCLTEEISNEKKDELIKWFKEDFNTNIIEISKTYSK